jgi:hypothetical protein
MKVHNNEIYQVRSLNLTWNTLLRHVENKFKFNGFRKTDAVSNYINYNSQVLNTSDLSHDLNIYLTSVLFQDI